MVASELAYIVLGAVMGTLTSQLVGWVKAARAAMRAVERAELDQLRRRLDALEQNQHPPTSAAGP